MLVHQAVLQQELWTGRRARSRRRCRCRGAWPSWQPRCAVATSSVDPMLRFLTAGESHGQALVVIVEGLPAGLGGHGRGHPGRDGPPPARLRAGPAPALRGRRADAARRRPPRAHARLAGRDRDQEHRVVPQRQVARRDVAGAGRHRGAAHPGAARPRRPRRDAEVRVHRRPRRAGTGQRPGDRGPRRRRRAWPSCCSATLGVDDPLPRHPDGRRRGRPASAAPDDRATSPASTSRRCAASTRRRRGDDRRDQGGRQGRRLARRRRRGARLRRAGRARAATSTGIASSMRSSPRR